ncbi:MAG: NTF2 fold immunity protein [Flavihumibacter sp.]|nr:NTF2 fold immunity protein [Flavihumibacter sp.]
MGEANARNELKVALSDTTIHNVLSVNSLIIKNKETAINVVEPILFALYSKDNIIKQRPYETYLIDNYWVVSGTLPKGYLGGTFLIIVDATNSKIIRLTHGK